ncbi:hypothetical protein [Paraburkholderia sp. BCC1884]|uniref:hypothetical protein n=1 Tax=Paraburkholderia sp. BCC1884 TaxID=2562668 RepID=UPI001183C051|nr:hypothetical protein [Paraburkholderia sp. BCC1884]
MGLAGKSKLDAWWKVLRKAIGGKTSSLPAVFIDPKKQKAEGHHVYADGTHVGRVAYRYVPNRFVFIDFIGTVSAHEGKDYATSVLAQLAAKHNAVIAPVDERNPEFWAAMRAKRSLPFKVEEQYSDGIVVWMKAFESDQLESGHRRSGGIHGEQE